MSSSLGFHRLTFVAERDDILVGRPDIDSYALFPADGAELLRRLQSGAPPVDAAEWYESSYGQPVDIEDFLATLRELGFVQEDSAAALEVSAGSVRFQRLGRAVFSLPATLCYAGVAIACALVMARQPELWPHPRNLFFSRSLVMIQLVTLLGQIPGVAWHETFHVLAGRRLGVPSRMQLGHRLHFIVVETTLSGLLGVPKRNRYLPFLAGMLADVVFFCGLTLGAATAKGADGSLSSVGRLALALAYLTVLRLAWQFYLFLRTDLYYVFATVLGCSDLHDATRAYLRNALWRMVGRPDRCVDDGMWSQRDRAVARWYAPFVGLGAVTLIGVAAVGVLPALGLFVSSAFDALRGTAGFGPRFWDAAASVLLICIQAGALLVIAFLPWLRSRRHTRIPASPSASLPLRGEAP